MLQNPKNKSLSKIYGSTITFKIWYTIQQRQQQKYDTL